MIISKLNQNKSKKNGVYDVQKQTGETLRPEF